MDRRTSLLVTFAMLVVSVPTLWAEATITAFYDKNPTQQKIVFRCIAKGLEAGNRYRIAVGTLCEIAVKDTIEIPQGAKIEKEEKKFVNKDIVRVEPTIKELKAQGYEINVQEAAPQTEVRVIFEISFKEIERLKTEKSPLYLYIAKQFGPDVFYLVDYYEMPPAKLLH